MSDTVSFVLIALSIALPIALWLVPREVAIRFTRASVERLPLWAGAIRPATGWRWVDWVPVAGALILALYAALAHYPARGIAIGGLTLMLLLLVHLERTSRSTLMDIESAAQRAVQAVQRADQTVGKLVLGARDARSQLGDLEEQELARRYKGLIEVIADMPLEGEVSRAEGYPHVDRESAPSDTPEDGPPFSDGST